MPDPSPPRRPRLIAPEELRHRQQWLLWRFEPPKKEGGKLVKAPYYVNGKIRRGAQGSPEDRAWLTNYNSAVDALSRSQGTKRPYTGIGFAFLPDDGLVGIDLDNMVDLVTGEIQPRAIDIIKACASYTERSPSRKGFHIFVRGDTAVLFDGTRQSFKNNSIGVEVFCGSQYFTFTGDHVGTSPAEVNEIDVKVLKRLHTTVAQARSKGKAGGAEHRAPEATDSETRQGSAPAAPTPPNDFQRVNDAAMANLDAWVPALFPAAKRSSFGWRVASRDLGRDLEEDISFANSGDKVGIVDYGVNDMGDPREGKRTPIDIVIEWSPHKTPVEALKYLAGRLGLTLSRRSSSSRSGAAGAARKPGGPGKPPPAGPEEGAGHDDGAPPPEGLPEIRIRQGLIPEAVDQAEAVLLAQTEDRIYQRAGFLTRVVRRDRPSVRNYSGAGAGGSLGFYTVDKHCLLEILDRRAVWKKFDAKAQEWRRCHCPDKVAEQYLSRAGRWKLPRLWAVISAPTLRPDGTLLDKPGYDEATCTWYDPGGVAFPAVPAAPTMEQAYEALEKLFGLFQSFPFESELDRAVAMALALTSLVRRSLPSAPLGAISAPVMASGKTLLASVIGILGGGVAPSVMLQPQDEVEAAKTVLPVLMEGYPVVVIDNVDRPLHGAWLCTIITEETFQGRMLGASAMVSVPTTTTQWIATGNQLVIEGDLRTRALLCRIDPKSEHPEKRDFDGDLRQWTATHRPELVAAGLTIMRAFIASGVPARDVVAPWGRFEAWSAMVRAPLVWLGCEDPVLSLGDLEKDDPRRAQLLQLMSVWSAAFGTEPATAREAINKVESIDPHLGATETERALREVLQDLAREKGGGYSSRKLGMWIKHHAGRRISASEPDGKGGLVSGPPRYFEKAGERDHTILWRVATVTAPTKETRQPGT